MVLGPAAVVVFTVTQRLMLTACAQVQSLGGSTWAALAELHHQGRREQFNARLIQLTRLTALLGLTALVPLSAFNRAFVGLWVGPERYGGDGLGLATLMFAWLQSVAALWAWPLVTTGKVRLLIPPLLVGTAVNLGVSVAATSAFGVIGPALGSTAQYALVTSGWIALLLRREFGTQLRSLAAATFWPVLPAIPWAVGWYLIADAFPPNELNLPGWGRWLVLACGMAAGAGGYALLACAFILPSNERQQILGWVRLRG